MMISQHADMMNIILNFSNVHSHPRKTHIVTRLQSERLKSSEQRLLMKSQLNTVFSEVKLV